MLAVNLKTRSEKRVRFERKTSLPYVPTPIGHEDHVYLWTDLGVLARINAQNGEETHRLRVNGNYSGSPVCIDGRLYCISEDGQVVVVSTHDPKVLGRTSLGDRSYSTPAVANGRLYLRTFSRLMCLKAKS